MGSEWDTLQSHYALYIARTDSNGGLLWTRSFSPAGAETQANAMEVTSDTGYALAGTIDWGDSARAWLVRIDPGADTLWTHALPGKGIEQGADVRQTADGGFVVAGTSDSAGGSVLLVKTDSLGGTAISVTEPSSPAREHAVFSVMPNPTSGFVRFESSSANADAELRLFDVTGRLVRLWIGPRNRVLQLDTRTLSAGVYLLRLSSGRSSATRELVVE